MIESDLIDVESLDFSDEQTWLYVTPHDTGDKVDIVDLSCDWPISEDDEYTQLEKMLYSKLDEILRNEAQMPEKHSFDSRTYVRPKKRAQRPSIQSIIEASSNSPSANNTLSQNLNKYLTYNKYSMPLGPINPMLRLKRFSVENNTEISPSNKETPINRRSFVPDDDPQGPINPMLRLKRFSVENNIEISPSNKETPINRRSFVQDDDPQLEDIDQPLEDTSTTSIEPSPLVFKPINIDLSQPAHNLHSFNKGVTNAMNERGSLNMYQSGESLMRMSPPSLVHSLMMESGGYFNEESLDGRKSISSAHRDSGIPPPPGRDSVDPMMGSVSLSIMDEKDMNTSFLSQTTNHDNDSFMDSLPPSLVSSVNSSYIVSNASKAKIDTPEPNIFSSTTFTNLEKSERLLTARPRCQLYNSFTKRDSGLRNSESYTKSREEACQIDTTKILNENIDKKDSQKATPKSNSELPETITLHYSNTKFAHDSEKENLNETFKQDNTFYKDNGMQRTYFVDANTTQNLDVTVDKQELNEIIQARQKLSLARKCLPRDEKPINQDHTPPLNKTIELPYQDHTITPFNKTIEFSKEEYGTPLDRTIQLPNQIITVPRQSMENASELLSRRQAMNGGFDKHDEMSRDTPRRTATFKKVSPKINHIETKMYVKGNETQNIIDINSATLNLIDTANLNQQTEDWGTHERAMVGSGESTDTGTSSSSSPPESVPHTVAAHAPIYTPWTCSRRITSTPLTVVQRGARKDVFNLPNTISPIFNTVNDDFNQTPIQSPHTPVTDESDDLHINNGTVVVIEDSPRTDISYDLNINNGTVVVIEDSPVRDISPDRVSPEKRYLAVPQKRTPTNRNPPVNRIPSPSRLPSPPTPIPVSSPSPTLIPPNNSGLKMPPPVAVPRKTGLPASKIRQYSSHRELNRIPGPSGLPRAPAYAPTMVRRGVYASNPVLSPTNPTPPARQTVDSAALNAQQQKERSLSKPALHREGTYNVHQERTLSKPVLRQGTYHLQQEKSSAKPLVRQGTYNSLQQDKSIAKPVNRQGTYSQQGTSSQPGTSSQQGTYSQQGAYSQQGTYNQQQEKSLPKPGLLRQGTETLRRERPQSQLVAPRDPPAARPYSIAGIQQLRMARPTSVPSHRPATGPNATTEPRPASSAEARASAVPRPSRLPAPKK